MPGVHPAASSLTLILAIAIAIYVGMGKPVLFAQPRPGKGGNIFTFYKFRTMVPDERESVVDRPDYAGSAPPDSQLRLGSSSVRPVWMNSPSSGTYSRVT